MPDSRPAPCLDDSLAFLRRWAPEGLWVLTSIECGQKRRTRTETFDARTQGKQALAWLTEQTRHEGENGRNVYFHVNPVREPVTRKASRKDIRSMAWLHVDVDPRERESLKSERERIRGLLLADELPDDIPQPTCITFSGGGYQAFWRLEDPYPIDGDSGRYHAATLWNLSIEIALGGDSCHNVDRIMRLPGTINWPDAKKRAKGRTPTLAQVVRWEDVAYPLARFTPAVPVQAKGESGLAAQAARTKISGNVRRLGSLDELGRNVTDELKAVIATGRDPDNPGRLSSRSEWVWFAVCELVRSGVDDETIYAVITDPSHGISAHLLDQSNTQASALRTIERAREHAIHPQLARLNSKHAVLGDVGGKCRIISEVQDGVLRGRSRLSFQTASDFKLRYGNHIVTWEDAQGKSRSAPLGHWWLGQRHRRQYDTLVFAPEQDVEGAYNLWRGFAYQSSPAGDCSLFLQHVRENVCKGNPDHYRYLLGWMALAVQHPARQGHVAIVLRGEKGTGKSFFAKTFGALFGRHFLQVADPKHLVGSFNAHLRDCVVLFGDEAFYAGDKKHESVLKRLVTEDTLTIEAKGIDAQEAPNFVHLILASNEDWVVPAGGQERRYFVLDVGSDKRQDSKWFGAIAKQLGDGGYSALLHALRTHDLSDFDVRDIPATRGLLEQKILSFGPERSWWYEKLRNGEVFSGAGWPHYVIAESLVTDYTDYTRSFGITQRGNATRLGLFLKRCFPEDHRLRDRLHSRTPILRDGREVTLDRPRIYRMLPLHECRAHWDHAFGGPYPWPEELEDDAGDGVPF